MWDERGYGPDVDPAGLVDDEHPAASVGEMGNLDRHPLVKRRGRPGQDGVDHEAWNMRRRGRVRSAVVWLYGQAAIMHDRFTAVA